MQARPLGTAASGKTMFDLFEQPWTLVGAAVLVLFGMLTFRSVLPEKRRWWQLALPAFIVMAAFGTDLLVQTDREKIHALLKKGMKAVEQRNLDALAAIIAVDYYDSFHNSKHYCPVKVLENRCKANRFNRL